MWRDLLLRLKNGRSRSASDADLAAIDPWDAIGRAERPQSTVFDRIEQTALAIYAEHGLPTTPGHYRRGRRARSWTFLGPALTPQERWSMLLDRPPDQGWRYGTLPDLGRSGPPEVRAAAALLADLAELRESAGAAAGQNIVELIEAAIRLGVDWRVVEGGRSKGRGTPLRLTAPDDAIDPPVRPDPAKTKAGPSRAAKARHRAEKPPLER